MDLVRLIAEKREQILRVTTNYGARNVRIFGSVARGDFDDKSDVDFLIQLDSTNLEGMRYFGILDELQQELERLLGCKVDVVDEKGLREKIKADVLAEARAL